MTRLHVEIEDLVAAARTMSTTIAEPSHRAACTLGVSLDDCASMAGNDPGGQSWASDYDDAAWTVLQATSQTVNAAYQTACMFAVSAVNYAEAESASTSDGSSASTTALLESLPESRTVDDPPRPPTTNGSRGDDGPIGWWIVEHSVGYVWPNGDSDRLRQAADAWDESASALSTNTCQISRVTTPFTSDRLPEADDINTVCSGLGTRLADLARAHWSLARACREYAGHLDTCHDEVVNELTWLLGESATLQVAGAILSGFSFGAAEIPTQAAQGLRVALSAERITHYIQTFLEAVTTVRNVVTTTAKVARDIQAEMASLANARVAYAGVTSAQALPAAGHGVNALQKARSAMRARKELAATRRLADEAGHPSPVGAKRPGHVVSPESREHILHGNNGGGGHKWPGGPGKTPFPKYWDDDQIIDNVGDIVLSPATRWHIQSGAGGLFTKNGTPAVWRSWEVRDGVRIRVAWEPATGRIRSAFPDSGPTVGSLVP